MILVTGGAGFIGSHLCERLLARGYEVLCLDNFNDFYDPALKEENVRALLDHPRFTLVRGDILDRSLLEDLFSRYSIQKVVHLAAIAGVRPSLVDPARYVRVDVEGTVNLLEMAKEHRIEQFIFGSSSSVYGRRAEGPRGLFRRMTPRTVRSHPTPRPRRPVSSSARPTTSFMEFL